MIDARPGPRRHAAAWLGAIALGGVLAGAGRTVPAGAATAARVAAQPAAPMTYALADTWHDVPWAATPGRYRRVRDLSSAPDGTLYVVDSRDIGFVHILAPDGMPRAIIAADAIAVGASDDAWLPCRVDVGAGGQVYVLSKAASCTSTHARLDRLAPDGAWVEEIPIGGDNNGYNDVAAHAGRLYLSRFGVTEGRGLGQVDVIGPGGEVDEVLSPPELGLAVAVDVAADGTLYVISRVEDFDTAPPPPGPQPTAEPSRVDAPTQAGVPVDGVVVFGADHRVRATHTFLTADDMDVAVGPAGVFVARGTEIFRLGERWPLYAGPAGYWGSMALDAPADGRLLGGLNHCHFRGLVAIADPAAERPAARLSGALDRPDLEGPVYPVRLAAGDAVAVLQGGYEMWGRQPDLEYSTLYATEQPQVVQRWLRAGAPLPAGPSGEPAGAGADGRGRLRSQLGLCGDGASLATRDVAIDGGTVYTVDAFNTLLARPDDLPPAWSTVLDAAVDADPPMRAVALSAGGGRIVVLDGAAGRVVQADDAGAVVGVWDANLGTGGLPVDIALDAAGGRVYVADEGGARVVVRGLDGRDRGAWSLPDGPARIAAGPGGDVFVLGRGGWGLRYSPDGALIAAWPMPRRDVDALDIAVDADGRVYVSYLRRLGHDVPPTWLSFGGFDILEAGVWVFEAVPAARAATAAGGCVARGDKRATPGRLPLGDTVTVTLAIDGLCPGRVDPLQLVVLLDVSGSMNKEGALDRAKAAALDLLGELDPRATEAALVVFGDGATTLAPLAPGTRDVAARLSAAAAGGDSRLAPALGAATAMLAAAPERPGGRRAVVMVTDGVIKDAPRAAADRARAAGIALYAIVVDNSEIQDLGDGPLIDLEDMTGGPEHVLFEPEPGAIARFARRMAGHRAAPGLFETLTIDDAIPANMDYVPDSARPAAAYDGARRVLAWELADIGGDPAGVRLTYRLRPRQTGRWPTNVEAVGVYRDALGQAGRLVFPVPEVEVTAPPARPIFLPLGVRHGCVRPGRPVDALLVIDTSNSMAELAPGGGRTKLDAARSAATALVDLLDPDADRVAVIAFNRSATVVLPPTADAAGVRAALARLTVDAGTRIDLGLSAAGDVLATAGRPGARAAVILLTDGLQSTDGVPEGAVLAQADRLKAAGAWVHAVGLGEAIDQPLLRAIAGDPDRFHASPTASDLEAIYRGISERLACGGG